jgi:hypothetical protein
VDIVTPLLSPEKVEQINNYLKNEKLVTDAELQRMAEYIIISVRTLNAMRPVPDGIREVYEIAQRILSNEKVKP